ncbi:Dimethyl sulfoxide/trimethylamine N-oxide reductase [Ascidiaceihabitans donghaensis]|uniref:Dimethyl sulfoxide/trimethylamine N-oxide reductase n=2 Tax=Ascidiaceihabitans donghaensis TaxID=1510460 RepID=A0A2R8BE97_9RHOB|nr:Dimethyl sulfoxide/trimethylamine N-oxide reductase [Ascidiaceihabitans donghaensis]
MMQKYTAAHWGAYEIHGVGDATRLKPLPRDPHPSTIGEGWLDAVRDTNTRIARPAVREGWLKHRDRARSGDAAFVEVPWDEALDLAGDALKSVIETYGNQAIYAGSYGWSAAGRFHHAQSQMRRFLNTIGGFTGSVNTYSYAGAEVLWPHIVGQSNMYFQNDMTSWPVVAEQCDLFVAFGGIAKRAAQVTSAGTTAHETQVWLDRAVARGCRVVNISPLGTDTETQTRAEWMAPRPGTDCALILALAFEVFRNGHANSDFLNRCTTGAQRFEDYVKGSDGIPKTPEWAAQICDVPAQDIRDLAHRMGTSKTMINMAWSMQRAEGGEITIWGGLCLACVLGQIGLPGTGFGYGYGSTESVGRPHKVYNWPSVPQGQNPVQDYIPVARVTDMLESPGGSYSYNGQARTYPDAKLVWWSGGNPFHHHQDLIRLDKAWRSPQTVVVMDHSWTATARRADIVLPTTSALERDDIMINRLETAMLYMSSAVSPYGQSRDDYDIFSDLSLRFGTQAAFSEGRSAEEWQHTLWQACQTAGSSQGIELPDWTSFKTQGLFDFSGTGRRQIQMEAFRKDPDTHRRATHSGRIEMESATVAAMQLDDCPASPEWRMPVESLCDAAQGQFHLLSGQPDTRLHSQNDTGGPSKRSKSQGREVCTVHPDAATAHGVVNGDTVKVFNDRGACLAGVRISAHMRPDCISLPTGAWLDLREVDGEVMCVHGNPNVLTRDVGSTQLSQGNIAHSALVRMVKWDGELPEIRVHSLPRFVSAT